MAPLSDEQKTIYALGLLMQRSIRQFDLSPEEIEIIKRALVDGAAGTPAIDLNEWGPTIEPFATVRGERAMTREKAVAAAYLERAASELGAVKTASGLVYRDITAGTGASPSARDTVKVHYRGTLVNGTVFDSSYDRGEPATFPLTGVVPCWTEGVQRMKVGGKARLVCPSDLAYGDAGAPTIPAGAALVFDIELLEIVRTVP
ncbi:MAG: FKBP-type peptidyl-prolyl cis-trans isomerase [Acidobacteria bacterium]|nr:FKBP-type peptidyl-prolyl cis-trans isomerase [Acidobacteriota bacterium]